MSSYKFALVRHFTLLAQVLKCCLQSSLSLHLLWVLVLSVYLPFSSSVADNLCGRKDSCQQPQQKKIYFLRSMYHFQRTLSHPSWLGVLPTEISYFCQ